MNVHGDAGSSLKCLAARIALGLVLVFGGISIASAQQQQQEEEEEWMRGEDVCLLKEREREDEIDVLGEATIIM